MVRGFGDCSRRPGAEGRLSAAQRFLAVISNSACRPVKTQPLRRGFSFFPKTSKSRPASRLLSYARASLAGPVEWLVSGKEFRGKPIKVGQSGRWLLHPRSVFLCRSTCVKMACLLHPGNPRSNLPVTPTPCEKSRITLKLLHLTEWNQNIIV